MQIVDSQIHIWENAKMSPQHRQIPTYSMRDVLNEMAEAGVDAAVIHPPSTLGEAVNVLAVEATRRHPDKFCILGHFDLTSPDRENIVRNWRQRAGMLGFRFTFNQPHQQSWWSEVHSTGSGRPAKKRDWPSDCWPAAIWPSSAGSPSATLGSNCISTITVVAAGAERERMMPFSPISAKCWPWPSIQTWQSSSRARRAIRANPTRFATSTNTF